MAKRRRRRSRTRTQDDSDVSREREESYADTQAKRLEEMAVRRSAAKNNRGRWSVPDDIKGAVIQRMEAIILHGDDDGKAIKASRVLLAADATDQRDDHAELNRSNGNDNIDELDAAIRSELGHMASGEETGPAAPTSPQEQSERVQPAPPLAETKDVPGP